MPNERYSIIKTDRPKASPNMAKVVSQHRRETLETEINNGAFDIGYKDKTVNSNQPTVLGNVLGYGIKKEAQSFTGTNTTGNVSSGYRGNGGTVRQTPEVYSPLWLQSNLNLPRDRSSINAWCRSFFALNPIVQNAITLHSTYPISKLNIKCKNSKANAFFENMIDEIDLMNICVQVAQEFWALGEAFVYAELDDETGKWSRLLVQNPDYIVVQKNVIAGEPIISLRPDDNLKRIVSSNRPSDVQQRQQINPAIVEHVKRGENIPLSNFHVSHIPRKISPYDVRGTGLPVSCFRALMLYDLLRECKFAQASDMINPLKLIKIGGGADNYKPTPADLEAWREVFEQATYDKNFKIITHDAVNIDIVGSGQGIYDTSNDITQLIKEIYIGLMVPQVIMDGGADVTYANGGVSLDVLRQRYMQFRNMMSSWLRRKIFAPISKIQGFYDYEDGKKVLIVPDIEWNHMSLFDMGDYIQNISQLISQEPRKVSLQTLYRSLGLEYEEEVRKIRRESIDMIIQAKEMEALQQMNLNDLRSIGEEDEIQEIQQNPLPGESALETPPGMSGGGAGGGLLGGGLSGPPSMGGGLGGGLLGGPPSGGGLTPPSGPSGGGGMTPPPKL